MFVSRSSPSSTETRTEDDAREVHRLRDVIIVVDGFFLKGFLFFVGELVCILPFEVYSLCFVLSIFFFFFGKYLRILFK